MSNHTPVPPIRPHLHFLIPSSSPSIHLEARLYLPPNPPLQSQSSISDSKPIIDPLPFSNSPTSHPIPASDLDAIIRRLAEWDVHTLITAAHPWGKMGGNMLDP